MDSTGDIPSREAIEPPRSAQLSPSSCAKVAMVHALHENGGVAHVYLKSASAPGDADDLHTYDYNTHCFPDTGWIFFHGNDEDKWIAGDDIGMIERHYE